MERPATMPDHSAALEQIFTCLKTKDDTQRFVGLTLLMRYLEGIQGNYDLIVRCWKAVPGTFLTRLLRAKVTNDKEDIQSKEETQIKFELGVTVLHTFISLLPTEYLQDLLVVGYSNEKSSKTWNLRINALMTEKLISSSVISTEIVQTLLSLATTSAGALSLYESTSNPASWISLLEQSPEQPMILEILSRTFIGVSMSNLEENDTCMQEMSMRLDLLLNVLMKNSYPDGYSKIALFDWFRKLFEALPLLMIVNANPHSELPGWLETLIEIMQKDITKHNDIDRGLQHSIVVLARLLLEQYPQFKSVFFDPSRKLSTGRQPYCYGFTNSLLIDIRATLPSLLEILRPFSYSDTSSRLAASYDLVFAHIDYILQTEDSDNDTTTSRHFDLILKLRDDIAEAINLTIECLCDRYKAISGGTNPLELLSMSQDPLVISQVGALGFWLHEDDAASADDALEVALRLYACNTDIAPLCMGVLEGMCRERKDLVQRAREVVEATSNVDEKTRNALDGAVESLADYYDTGQREVDNEYEDEDGVYDDGVYDYN